MCFAFATGIMRSRNAWSTMFCEPSQKTATRFVVVESVFISSNSRAPPSSANFVASSANPIWGPAAAAPVITSASAPMTAAMSLFTPCPFKLTGLVSVERVRGLRATPFGGTRVASETEGVEELCGAEAHRVVGRQPRVVLGRRDRRARLLLAERARAERDRGHPRSPGRQPEPLVPPHLLPPP